jgi:hypothetical protein
MGPMLDSVMGMSIEESLFLCEKFVDLTDLVRRIDVKLLLMLCQLTFKTCLGLQPAFDEVD